MLSDICSGASEVGPLKTDDLLIAFRMKKEWIPAKWGTSSNNRKARFYSLTRGGRKQLAQETSRWRKLAAAIGRVLGPEIMEG